MENMNKETCDYYEPKLENYRDKLCKYFIGDIEKKHQVESCRYHCSILESQDCMKERSYIRHKGALKQRL